MRSRLSELPAGLRWGAALLALLAVVAVAAPLVTGDPGEIGLDSRLQPPSGAHWLGTDDVGRDVAARVAYGARVSLGVGTLSVVVALLVGLPLGAAAGYLGGWADASISRVIEALLCFPTLLLALAILAVPPDAIRALPDLLRVAGVIGLTGWVPMARYLRAEFLRLGRSEMVQAARASGAGHLRLVAVHLLPSGMAPVLVTAAFAVGAAVALEAALSFLGLGVQPETPSWGGTLRAARDTRSWWMAVFPGLALFATVLGCNLVGEGLRDMLDPRTAGRR